MKKSLLRRYSLFPMVASFLFLVNQAHAFNALKKINVPGYVGTAHQAFKVAEVFVDSCMNNVPLSDALSVPLGDSFLSSLHIDHDMHVDPQAYALLCSDICADEIWINYDKKKRDDAIAVASRIVFINTGMRDGKKGFCADDIELKKLLHHCKGLKEETNYCFVLVFSLAARSDELAVLCVKKTDSLLQGFIVGNYTTKAVEFVQSVFMNDKQSKKLVRQCLDKNYSSDFVTSYVACLFAQKDISDNNYCFLLDRLLSHIQKMKDLVFPYFV